MNRNFVQRWRARDSARQVRANRRNVMLAVFGMIVCLLCCAVNIPFIVDNPKQWLNWVAAVWSFAMAMFCAMQAAALLVRP